MAHIKATNTPPAKVLKIFAALMFFILGMAALNAKTAAWKGPEQFVLINGIDMEYNWAAIREHFGPMEGKKIAVGGAFIVYCFERDENFLEEEIREHLKQAQENVLPVLVQLDTITFMTARPDLWNWWDESKPGYNPENVSNVEWTGWSPKDAVKIGWLNWGRQIRLHPMPNLASPQYRAESERLLKRYMNVVKEWHDALPADKKWLLVGVKIMGEIYFGANNFYYPDGNKYVDEAPENDPAKLPSATDLPSRGMQTIGYAALKAWGMKDSGEITAADIFAIEKKHSLLLSEFAAKLGLFPREMLFSHASGAGGDLDSCVNGFVSPSWSFYNNERSGDATHPAKAAEAKVFYEKSDAPWFGVSEWSLGEDSSDWTPALKEALAMPKCRFISIYANVVGSDIFHFKPNLRAIESIRKAVAVSEKN